MNSNRKYKKRLINLMNHEEHEDHEVNLVYLSVCAHQYFMNNFFFVSFVYFVVKKEIILEINGG